MAPRIIFDRADRLLRKAQSAIQREEFDVAIEHLREAITLDSSDAHLHLNLGIALAEAGHSAEAEASFVRARTLRPRNCVLVMWPGIHALDEGQVERAAAHFRDALAVTPTNPIASFYLLLARWDGGEIEAMRDAPHQLGAPRGLGSRVLLRIERERMRRAGACASVASFEDTEQFAAETRAAARRVVAQATSKQLQQAAEAFRSGGFEDVIDFILDHPDLHATSSGMKLLSAARVGATSVLQHVLDSAASDEDLLGGASGRRQVLLRLSRLQLDGEDFEAALRSLVACRATLPSVESGHARGNVETVLLRTAHVQLCRGAYDEAKTLCHEARALRGSAKLDWMDAIAHIGLGDMRRARRSFDAFLRRAKLFPVGDHLRRFLAGDAAQG